MITRYLGTLLLTLLAFCIGLSLLPFAQHAQVRAGDTVDENWTAEFTLDKTPDVSYRLDSYKSDLESGIRFIGSGPVKVQSTKIDITPQDVSWKENKTRYTAPGAKMIAHVQWTTPQNAPDGATGDIQVEFPKLRGIPGYSLSFHSGAYQKTGDGRTLFREIGVYRSTIAVALARLLYVGGPALAMSFFVHAIAWGIYLSRVKKARLAELSPQNPQAIPRLFHPNPIAEWSGWTLTLGITGSMGTLISCFAMIDGFLSSSLERFILGALAVGLMIGVIVILAVRASVVTVRLDAGGVGLAKGRGEPRWNVARWGELRNATVKSKTYKGNTTVWLELVYPTGKTYKVPSSVCDFQVLCQVISELRAPQPMPGGLSQ